MIRLNAELTPAGTSYLATGQGQPVVLIHGVGLNKEMWGGQIVGLATQYRVIAYDMLGHGASPRPASGTGLLGYAEQLLELLDHLQLPLASVIGFSMGGLVARAFALHHPERLKSLVVLNSVFNRSEEQRAGVIARTAQAAEHGRTPMPKRRCRAGSAVNIRPRTRRRSPRSARPWPATIRRVT